MLQKKNADPTCERWEYAAWRKDALVAEKLPGSCIHRVTITYFQCQLAFAAILWVKVLEIYCTVMSLKYALLAS